METRLKRFLSLVMAILMVVTLLPANNVFAEGDAAEGGSESAVCTGLADCLAETHNEDCAKKLADEETAKQQTEPPKPECNGAVDCSAETHAENCLKKLADEEAAKQPTDPPKPVCTGLADCAAENHEATCEKKIADDKVAADKAAADTVASLIAALPTLEQLQAMPLEEQTPYYNQVQSIYGSYNALTEEQKALLSPAEEVFKPYFDYFNSLTAEAMDITDSFVISGSCGDNLTWELDEDGVLTISGSGEMQNCSASISVPWESIRSEIKSVVIENGVTSIGDAAFSECSNLTSVTIPESVTDIGENVFSGCSSLTSVTIPEGVTRINTNVFSGCSSLTSVTIPDSVIYIEFGAFEGCTSLTSIAIPEGVIVIGGYGFNGCTGLTSITIPDSMIAVAPYAFDHCTSLTEVVLGEALTKIEYNTFSNCTALQNIVIPEKISSIGEQAFAASGLRQITFKGDAPTLAKDVFEGVTATAYYPAGNETWTEEVRQSYGGTITWMAYESEEDAGKVYRLNELESVDFLALADLCYSESPGDDKLGKITIREMLGEDKWKRAWSSTDIKNSELFAKVGNWTVYDVKENSETGFGAYIFKNDYNEFVISYRGSNDDIDWTENNIPMLFGMIGPQVYEAIDFPADVIALYGSDCVRVTGHSLGGALCDIVSARYGCKAESFNAAPFLTNAYRSYPKEMGELFAGVDKWLFFDHITENDLVGSTNLVSKKYIIHEKSQCTNKTHSLKSMVTRDLQGKPCLTNYIGGDPEKDEAVFDESISKIPEELFYFGTSKNNELKWISADCKCYVFEGNGNGIIYTGIYNDIYVGGRGNDSLDGSYGDDKYYYFRGDGIDHIRDIYGQDEIIIYGYNTSDELDTKVNGEFVDITINDETIIRVDRNRKKGSYDFTVTMHSETHVGDKNIISILTPVDVKGRTVIACPVSVEVIDDTTGNVVHTMVSDESGVGAAYTDYGFFYVYQDESGEYVKVADLFEGYSLRIVGEDGGTMDVSVYEATEEGLAEPVSLTDVPVTDKLSATIEKKDDGKLYLIVDSNSDDETDEEILFEEDSENDDTTNVLKLEDEDLKSQSTVWINGLPYEVKSDGENRYVEFESDEDCMMVTYEYHVGDASDVHTQYPTGMKVYRISDGKVTYIPELDNLLQYSGSSIRITGKKGIRMITSLYQNTKAALIGNGLAGYKLVENGTMLCWSSEIADGDALVLGKSFTRSNYAYKRGVADPVFATSGNLTQYTNVLVGFTNEQCKDDIAMRPYIILEDANGEQFTVYGGTIHRSIGYIAYQNRKAFSVGSGAYNYVWDIIHYVYGNKYDADYKG